MVLPTVAIPACVVAVAVLTEAADAADVAAAAAVVATVMFSAVEATLRLPAVSMALLVRE